MNKKILIKLVFVLMLCIVFMPILSLADNISRANVEHILAGEQDLLVFANIVSKDQYSYEVQITEVIAPLDEDNETDNTPKLVNQKISVDDFGGYMYFNDNSRIVPQLGDNVLLSLETAGNRFYVKNGAYKVDYASSELFSFIAPESYTGSSEIAELKALYLFVGNKAKLDGISISDNTVFIKGEDGKAREQNIAGGISLIDADGELTEKPAVSELYNSKDSSEHVSHWLLAAVIIVFGMAIGAGCIIFANKFERRYDEN